MDKPYNTTVRGQEDAEKAAETISEVIDSLMAHIKDAVSELVCQAGNVLDEGEALDHPDHGAGFWVPANRWDDLARAYSDAV